jgi:hypothetical protein
MPFSPWFSYAEELVIVVESFLRSRMHQGSRGDTDFGL